MKNSILFIALVLLISSCGIFKDSTKNKTKVSLDSTIVEKTVSKTIDTGSITNYEKITLYFQPGSLRPSENSAAPNNVFDFASGLVGAARGLANASINLRDSTRADQQKGSSPAYNNNTSLFNLPGLVGAEYEKYSNEKKGLSDEKAAETKIEVKQNTAAVEIVEKPNATAVFTFGLLGYLSVAIVLIGLFLWFKSRQ